MKEEINRIYRTIPPEKIPWNVEAPPAALMDLVEGGKIKPCKAVDLGCGIGNYCIYLTRKGFNVTGIDIAPAAIQLAKQNAKKRDVKVNFLVADLLGTLDAVPGTFDFAFDWEVLHHVFPEHRAKYIENVYRLLNPGGKYLSVCFSEKDTQFGGTGKFRKTNIGTLLYFSSEEELRALFEPHFTILELKTVEISGKIAPHLANLAFMERK